MGKACPQPKETMVCGGVWAWDSNELIQTEWAWTDDEKAINNKPAIMLKRVLFIITSSYITTIN